MYVCVQLDSKTIEELDSNLKEGPELTVLYNELLKTISKDYLSIDSVRMHNMYKHVLYNYYSVFNMLMHNKYVI